MLFALTLAALAASPACKSNEDGGNAGSRGIIVVNAPASGEVRRVVAREGMSVNEGAPLVEIAVLTEMPAATPSPGETAEARAARNFKGADAEIEAARAEAVRHEAEVLRLQPMVSAGEAPQSQLDGERALYEQAQRRLQQAQDSKRNAENELRAARQPVQNQAGAAAPSAQPREQLVSATASAAGTVSVISVRVGERVKAGQPLATLRAEQ